MLPFGRSGVCEIHINDTGYQVRTYQTNHNSLRQDEQAGGNRIKIFTYRHSRTEVFHEPGVKGEIKQHEYCKSQNADSGRVYAHRNARNVIIDGIFILLPIFADRVIDGGNVENAVENSEEIPVAEPQQVHGQEERNETGEHPKAILDSNLFHGVDFARFLTKI